VETLSGWPEPRVRAAIRAYRKSLAAGRSKAVVMLHTEAAFTNAERVNPFHIDVARDFLPRPTDDRTRAFAARWHGFVAQVYAFRNDEQRAQLEIALGFAVDSRSRDATLARGVLVERSIRQIEPNLRGTWYSSQGAVTRLLASTSQSYRMTLAEHPDFLEARLRHGWVSHLDGSQQAAREQLDIVAAQASRAELLYLAHLFLGALHEKGTRLDEAIRHYEMAYAMDPSQSAAISVIRVETLRGHLDRAQQVAAAFADRPPLASDDPWWSFSGGLTSAEPIEWLRREARAQGRRGWPSFR